MSRPPSPEVTPLSSSGRELAAMKATCRALLAVRGEAVVSLADQVIRRYRAFDTKTRLAFFDFLAAELECVPDDINAAYDTYRTEPNAGTLQALRDVLETPRLRLFRALNTAPTATQVMVEMRAVLIKTLPAHPHLDPVEADLFHVLSSWFNRGFLRVRRIDWTASASVVEKIIDYEAVHEIRGWGDLRRRLQRDRRCFAFFHPALPDDPIIFVEVALTDELTNRIATLLEQEAPADPMPPVDTAIFYSINNCQPGLRGIEFGSFLLKKVMEVLEAEMPELNRFSTLSPVPGLMTWLKTNHTSPALAWLEHRSPEFFATLSTSTAPTLELVQNAGASLETACAQYLTEAKRGIFPLDPVARFHLRNGARLERINPLGDLSDNGLRQSAGVLVNYRYVAAEVEANHEAFINSGEIACHPSVEAALTARAGDEPSRRET